LIEAALRSSEKQYGKGAITRKELQESLDKLLALEKDLAHCRKLCSEGGLNLQAINFLSQMIRQNPGDGGEGAINTLLGYAVACDVSLAGVEGVINKYFKKPESVLPRISRDKWEKNTFSDYSNMKNMGVGLVLTCTMFLIFV
jgi:hypothetical protein